MSFWNWFKKKKADPTELTEKDIAYEVTEVPVDIEVNEHDVSVLTSNGKLYTYTTKGWVSENRSQQYVDLVTGKDIGLYDGSGLPSWRLGYIDLCVPYASKASFPDITKLSVNFINNLGEYITIPSSIILEVKGSVPRKIKMVGYQKVLRKKTI